MSTYILLHHQPNITDVVKWDPAKVAREMEEQTINGDYLFHVEECLSQSQIKSFFSRLAAKQRTSQIDVNQSVETDFVSASTSLSVNEAVRGGSPDASEDVFDDSELQLSIWNQWAGEAKTILESSSTTTDLVSPSHQDEQSYRRKHRSSR